MKAWKSILGAAALATVFMFPMQSEAGVRVYVRFGPPRAAAVRVVKPACPYRDAIWVKGHYVYRHGRYVYVKGHWVQARRGYRYVQPHWVKTPRGYFFVAGHWVKV